MNSKRLSLFDLRNRNTHYTRESALVQLHHLNQFDWPTAKQNRPHMMLISKMVIRRLGHQQLEKG